MSERYVPGPYDSFRGIVDINCYECLSPEQKAQFRIGKWIPVTPPLDETGTDSNPPSPPDVRPPDGEPPGT